MLTLVSPVPHLPASAHGDPECHDATLRALHQAKRREAPLPVSASVGVGQLPLGRGQADQAWSLHFSLQVHVEETQDSLEVCVWGGGEVCNRMNNLTPHRWFTC